jgi:hypothetical protein
VILRASASGCIKGLEGGAAARVGVESSFAPIGKPNKRTFVRPLIHGWTPVCLVILSSMFSCLHNAYFDGAAYSALSALGRRWDVAHRSIKRVLHYVHRATGTRGADRYG